MTRFSSRRKKGGEGKISDDNGEKRGGEAKEGGGLHSSKKRKLKWKWKIIQWSKNLCLWLSELI